MPSSSLSAALLALALASVGHSTVLPGTTEPPAIFPHVWVSDMFYRGLANFSMRDVGNAACQKQSEMYEKNLRNFTSWAVRMAESWVRHPIGLISGNQYHLGLYDECIEVQYPIRGQYCIPEFKLTAPLGKDYSFNRTENFDDYGNNHAWRTVLGWGDYDDQLPRNVLRLGVCIPDSCTVSDLRTALQKKLEKVFVPDVATVTVKADPILCTVSGDMYPFTTAFYVTSGIFLTLILIGCVVTLHHFVALTVQTNTKEINRKYNSIIGSFSFIMSITDLVKYDKNNELNPINGVKFVIMIFILFGHRFLYLASSPLSHTKTYENIFLYGPSIVLTSMNLVDLFFFISGFLLHLTILPVFKKPGKFWIQLISPIIYRVARLLPSYCAMMAFTAHILPHLGDGPFWPEKTWHEAEKCQNYWWTNVLFINNFMDAKYQCLLVSWYIACDIQFFVVGIVILYVYVKNRKLGVRLLIAMSIVSLIIPIVVTFVTKSDGMLKTTFPFLYNPRTFKWFSEMYRSSYMRIIPFFAGLGCAVIVEILKENKFKFSKMAVFGGTFLVVLICSYIQLYGSLFYKRDRPYNTIENALYSSLSHCSWTGIIFYCSIIQLTTGYGVLSKLISNRLFVIFGRLSYAVFLVNLLLMLISQSSHRLTIHSSAKSLVDAWIYDTFKTYLMAATLYLIVEAPLGNIVRIIFGRGPKKNSAEDANHIPIGKIDNGDNSKNNEWSNC